MIYATNFKKKSYLREKGIGSAMYTIGEAEGDATGLGGEEDSEPEGDRVSRGTDPASPLTRKSFDFMRSFGAWCGNGGAFREEVHPFKKGEN